MSLVRRVKSLFGKRSNQVYVSSPDEFSRYIYNGGYVRMSESPEVQMAVDKIANLVSDMTIQLMENTEHGDVRINNALSRKIDIEPYQHMTRKAWVYKVVRDLLLYGEGNSVAHISVDSQTGLIKNLTPFNMGEVSYKNSKDSYEIEFGNKTYKPEEVVHFVMNPDPRNPQIGTGYKVALKDVVRNLKQAQETKNTFMKGKYMPSLIIKADGLTEEFKTEEGRNKILDKYISSSERGQPWVIPADLLEVQEVKPLTLNDLAINESTELDKRTIAGLLGVPAFLLGVGEFNNDEYNNFIQSTIMSIGNIIAQTLTKDIIINQNWYFKMNPRSLYNYSLTDLVQAGGEMVKMNAMRRNELRNWIGLDPDEEMNELIVLENYIKQSDIDKQSKLHQDDTLEGGDTD